MAGGVPVLYEVLKKQTRSDSIEPVGNKDEKPEKLYNDRDSDEYWNYLFECANTKPKERKVYNDRNSDEYWEYIQGLANGHIPKYDRQENTKEEKNVAGINVDEDGFMDVSDIDNMDEVLFGSLKPSII